MIGNILVSDKAKFINILKKKSFFSVFPLINVLLLWLGIA